MKFYILSQKMRNYRKLFPAQESKKEDEWLLAKDVAVGGIKMYYIYQSIDQFLVDQEKHRKHYYEILNGKMRVFLDIDIPKTTTSYSQVESFLQELSDKILYMYKGTKINIYTTPSTTHYSYHIILPDIVVDSIFYVQNAVRQLKKLNNPLSQFIDDRVYKSNQLFRMLGSSKIEQQIKVPYGDTTDILQDSLVQPIYLTIPLSKKNAINIISRIQYIDSYLYNLLDTLDLHPDWFAFYMNPDPKPTNITSKIFWKQLLSAAVKVQNYSLVENILMKQLPLLSQEEKIPLRRFLSDSRVPDTYINLIPAD